jgi:hypothetical protein
MRKRLIPIYAVLVVAMILLAALAPSCGGGPTTGTIVVQATLCGVPWQGAVNYTLTLSGGTSPISGTGVPTSHGNMTAGTWTCAYVAGGPAGAFLNSIKPSASQVLAADGTITFTLDFELDQDAAIQWLTWTQDGIVLQVTELETVPCHIIDAHFKQWVKGCDGYNVTMNETSWLMIQYALGPAPAMIVVVDDPCAVNKTPQPLQKVSQWPSIDDHRVEKGYNVTLFPMGTPAILDVHTQWQLVKGTNYTKAINWFGISRFVIEPMAHPCVLFELVLPLPGQYQFILQTSAEVALVGDTDVNPANNSTMSTTLLLTVNVPQ